MSRNIIVKMLDDQYTTTKVDMQNMQYEKNRSDQGFVANATDAWSTNNKSYLGVTVR